jgi:general nucleoside transport system ATP-binding protein
VDSAPAASSATAGAPGVSVRGARATAAPGGPGPAVQLQGIQKSFFGTPANDNIDVDLTWGEVHSLLGENGAGKTTLCSVLAGLYRPDAGSISIDGVPRSFHSPRDALAAGIGMVYQHFRLVDRFTVAENLALGHPDTRRHLSRREIERRAGDLAERYGMSVRPDARIWELSVGEQQRVEILKLLHRGVRVLILDEPTAVLTPQETDSLFAAIRVIQDQGRIVVFVSHKLHEVLKISDRITVLRAGRRVGQLTRDGADAATLARMMVGRDLALPERGSGSRGGSLVLSISNLTVVGDHGRNAVDGVGLEVRGGEIVGVAGVAGNGQRELAEALAGIRKTSRGRVFLNARDITHAAPAERIRLGLAFVPEDRLDMGVAAELPLEDNLALKSYRDAPIARGPLVSMRQIHRNALVLTERFDIRGARRGLPVSLLSGGNLQRAILAREISRRPPLLIAASPTRGLDVAATETVRRILLAQRDQGTAILLMSEDLDELQALCDRMVVMYEGRMVGEVDAEQFDAERIGLMMAGHFGTA